MDPEYDWYWDADSDGIVCEWRTPLGATMITDECSATPTSLKLYGSPLLVREKKWL
ncbi:excalibur calcium-binding domain-containing protein [Knoellia sp. CPCC 206450]|uniref:excalibur calcium-binding domain-containing protein n=1 Tax=Knoellia tibetensis TaxID=3404798 RepID=UPI003B42C307